MPKLNNELNNIIIPQLNILIIDDEEDILEDIKYIIFENQDINIEETIRQNINVLTAKNGAQALEILKNCNNINLILSDILMPIMDGYQLCKILRTNPAFRDYHDIPFFFISGTVKDTNDKIKGLELDADQVFSKPYDPLLLGNHIRKELYFQINLYNKKLDETKKLLIIESNKNAQKENSFYFVSSYTYSHSARVAILTNLIGDSPSLHLTDIEKISLNKMVLEHDKGKIGIPEEILNKPVRLMVNEIEIIQMHTLIAGILLNTETIDCISLAEFGEVYHHEKYYGDGYPTGKALVNEDIYFVDYNGKKESIRLNLLISIINLADALDAISSKRPYKEPVELKLTSQIFIKDCFSHFHPKVVEAFFERLIEPDHKLLKRIDRYYNQNSILLYFNFFKAMEILNSSNLFTQINEYYKQDIPQNNDFNEIEEIRRFFLEEVINQFYLSDAILTINNTQFLESSRQRLIKHFKKKFKAFIETGKYNLFIVYHEYIWYGWSRRLLDINDLKNIKKKIFEELKKINDINDRLKKIKTIKEANKLLFLLETYFYFESIDYKNIEVTKYLAKEYNYIQQKREELVSQIETLKISKNNIIIDTMTLFQNKIQEMVIQLKNNKELNLSSEDSIIPNINKIINELEVFFKNVISHN